MRPCRVLCALAALALLCSPTLAANFIFGGDTTGSPVFNRPVSFSSLSGVGTAVPYDVVPFYVTASGTYTMELYSISGFDPYAFAYSSFSAGSPLTGLLDGDDDYSGLLPILGLTGTGLDASYIAPGQTSNYSGGTGLSLTAFTQYYAVVTGFGNTDFGQYEGAIGGGPGDAVGGIVPEPSSIVLGAFGLAAAVAYGLRRRSA